MKPNRTWKLAVATVSSGALAAAALTGGAALADSHEGDVRDPITVVDSETATDTAETEEQTRRFTGAEVAADARTKAPGTPALPARLNAEERAEEDVQAQSDTPDSPESPDTPESPDSPATADSPDSPDSPATADSPVTPEDVEDEDEDEVAPQGNNGKGNNGKGGRG